MSDSDIIEIVKIVSAATGAIVAFFVGRNEYRKSVKIKRAEFLDKLIAEFLDKSTLIARNMLDNYVYVTDEMKEMTLAQQTEKAVPLSTYLRDHNKAPITDSAEITVRRSFDSLLDFFTKLSYYLSNDLISPSELIYFRFYLNKLQEKQAEVDEYINTYFYKKDIKILMDALQELNNGDPFTSSHSKTQPSVAPAATAPAV